jgi:opacity protein-like surface antigen
MRRLNGDFSLRSSWLVGDSMNDIPGSLKMNKVIISLAAIGAALSFPPHAATARDSNPTGLYLGANLGVDFYNDASVDELEDEGGSIGFQLGYRWSERFRTELELSGSATEIEDSADSDDVVGFGRLTLGVYYDFLPTSQALVPYVGGGIGVAGVVVEIDEEEEDEDGFLSVHGEAGLTLNITEHFALIPSYRYTWVEDDTELLDDDLTSHSVRVGARVSF